MLIALWFLTGLLLGAGFVALARRQAGRERRLLALGLVVAALVYVGLALFRGASMSWLAWETVGAGLYGTLAWLGWRSSPWWLMLGWGTHPVWDVVVHFIQDGSAFVPTWYAIGCVSFDLLIAVYIVGQTRRWLAATSGARV